MTGTLFGLYAFIDYCRRLRSDFYIDFRSLLPTIALIRTPLVDLAMWSLVVCVAFLCSTDSPVRDAAWILVGRLRCAEAPVDAYANSKARIFIVNSCETLQNCLCNRCGLKFAKERKQQSSLMVQLHQIKSRMAVENLLNKEPNSPPQVHFDLWRDYDSNSYSVRLLKELIHLVAMLLSDFFFVYMAFGFNLTLANN